MRGGPHDRSEASIQRAVTTFAKELGCITIKQTGFKGFGTAGWPDYLFLTPRGRAFFIEFKRLGCVMTPLQSERAKELGLNRIKVYVVDNVDLGKEIVFKEAKL